ncbi:ATP-binding cassette domain-containing protein [Amycolatopsis nigrescens]|uniref:ATP-binding cassette domain-containing protein n=1 Tax=Amycolatopsis nigrescens TaxID=381445 RepID=UPI00039EAB99|nr:ATP-binding cassette domain-containing protein [Amycolatopsis nigrescens]
MVRAGPVNHSGLDQSDTVPLHRDNQDRPRIKATGLGKTYGTVTALADVGLRVPPGRILGILGHNGAGKTTLIDILGTRVPPSTGTAEVCGFDVRRDGHEVRRRIGITGQSAAVDDALSGRDNLVLVARLLGANRRQAKARASELLDSFGLSDAADRQARTYSGGMRRRLDLAASLVGSPEVLFLDEPTTGLDPVSRTELWRIVRDLATGGAAVVLTTQYLEEADRLADEVLVLGLGRIVAAGTPQTLKDRLGKRTATLTFGDAETCRRAFGALEQRCFRPARDDSRHAVVAAIAESGDIAVLVRTLDAAGIGLRDLTVAEPTLDDVYLSLLGHLGEGP